MPDAGLRLPVRTYGPHLDQAQHNPLTRMTMKNVRTTLLVAFSIALASPAAGQQVPWSPMNRSSDNMEVLGHLPLGAQLSVADMDLEQEMDRPYAYISRMVYG